MRTFRDSVAKVTFPLKKHKKIRGKCPLCVPSPYGDVFLRNQILMFHMKQGGVSVPLRGCGFEILAKTLEITDREKVSVPLRGCGFEIVLKLIEVNGDLFCFRPLAGMWF